VGVAIPIPRGESFSADAGRRLARLRRLSWLLDRAIPVGRWRIGIDPIIGLVPGMGDWIGAILSLYILYQGARLGVPAGVVARMGGNILVEAVFGAVPVLGDIFDFAWQANTRNLTLIERHCHPTLELRSTMKLWATVGLFVLLVLALITTLAFLTIKLLDRLLAWAQAA
jgi:hypothetical protein